MFKHNIFYILISVFTLLSSPVYSKASLTECHKASIKYAYKGNNQYAWFYITNSNAQEVNIVVENSWYYKGRKSEKKDVILRPDQKFNIFNFARNQNPKSKVLSCLFI